MARKIVGVKEDVKATNVTVNDGGTIGSVSDPDALTIAANGDVTASQDLIVAGDLDASNITVDDGGTIGSVSDPDAITIDSSGDVGIGTTSPSNRLHVSAGAQGVVAQFTGFVLDRGLEIGTAGIGGSTDAGIVFNNLRSADGTFIFRKAGTEQVRVTSDGYLRMASGTGGIQFNGDTASANALDDYEEGTWTPTVTSQTGSFTTITINDAHYTRIGRVVTAFAEWTITDVGTGSGWINLTLPFSTDNEIERMFAGGRRTNDAEFIHGGASSASDQIETILTSDGSSAIVDGYRYAITITYFTDA